MQETQVRSLVWEDPLEKEMLTFSSILVGETPWTEQPSGLQSMGVQSVRHGLATQPPPPRVPGVQPGLYILPILAAIVIAMISLYH